MITSKNNIINYFIRKYKIVKGIDNTKRKNKTYKNIIERCRTPPRGRFWRNTRAHSGRKQKKNEKRKKIICSLNNHLFVYFHSEKKQQILK
jgi:hypothetical protein